jgi:uncharacterized protein YjbI with pentapeptide repeats
VANPEHLNILGQGSRIWNAWRFSNFSTVPDLKGANLSGEYLGNFFLNGADLSEADLRDAVLLGASLSNANLRGANLEGAWIGNMALHRTNLSGANLRKAKLQQASLLGTDLEDADLTGCYIHGISVWGAKLNEGTKQQDLIITAPDESIVTVGDLEVAQFIYLMLHNEKIRRVIDTITSKVVLILGSFSRERKMVLDALRDELRTRTYVPVVFDFEKPRNRTTDETITLLARMARFVIADISDAKSVLQELRAIVPDNPSVPVQSIIDAAQDEPGMFDFFKEFRSFLKVYRYRNPAQLLANLDKRVIAPPEAKAAKRGANTKLAFTRLPP